MEIVQKSKLFNFGIFVFSILLCTLITLPIFSELDSGFTQILLGSLTLFGIISLDITIKKKINEFIHSEFENRKTKHIQEFFTYLENDKRFLDNVLKRDIPIFDSDNKEIGSQTIYSALSDKKYYFMR